MMMMRGQDGEGWVSSASKVCMYIVLYILKRQETLPPRAGARTTPIYIRKLKYLKIKIKIKADALP